jgi:AcrR family transcriptional regulator
VSPRPRKASDAEIFAAAHRVMMRVGPEQFTLAEIAGEAGLTAGALVQRFGSKLGLLRAIAGQLTEGSAQLFAAIRAEASSPLDAVWKYGECMARMGGSPGALAHHLAWLQLDLTDDEMHRHLAAQAAIARATLRGWLDDATDAGELERGSDTAGLARTVQVTISGSLLASAFDDTSATASMRRDLDAVLAPYLPARSAVARSAAARTRRRRKDTGGHSRSGGKR